MPALRVIGDVGILVFVVATMAGLGLQLTMGQILGPLADKFLVAKALVANFVLAPALALAIRAVLPLDDGFAIGLILMATAAGAPFLPPLARIARGDVAASVGLVVLLMGVTVLFLPAVLPLLIPGVRISPLAIAKSLVLLMLVPLAIGLIVNRERPATAARWLPIASPLAKAGLALGAIALLALHGRSLLGAFGSGAVLTAIALAIGMLLIGWLVAGADKAARSVLMLATGARNIPAALVVAEQNFEDPNVLVMCLLFAFVSVAGLFVAARLLGRRSAPASRDALSEH